MEIQTQENKQSNGLVTLYRVVSIIFVGITIIYPLAYVGMMYMATKLAS